jgi:NADPH-dependent glutamate synthase beta subunit-like oxidoreductase
MRPFRHTNAQTLTQAGELLAERDGRAAAIAGGTDLLGALKDEIYAAPPQLLVNLKTIPDLATIRSAADGLHIGALTKLHTLEADPTVRGQYPLLAEAARAVASPQIRRMGTVGGNICQAPRCWYYRAPENAFHCTRKDGQVCNALTGENRYHSIFGAVRVASTPCTENCPTHVDIAEYMALLRAGDPAGAARRLLATNPMPAITGRVCPHLCETACNRGSHDEAVSVRNVERFLGDHVLDNPMLLDPPAPDSGRRVVIVGAGPAGLAAAHYLRQVGHRVVVLDRMPEPGGMLRYAIPAYRLPADVVARTVRILAERGVEFRQGVNVGQDVTVTQLRQEYDAVFLAAGAWGQPPIGLDGEALTHSGLQFLTQVRMGTPEPVGRRVVVIGGGSVATDVAITARRSGAEQVTIVCLECREEMPAFEEEIEQSLDEGVRLLTSWGPSRVLESGGRVTGLEIVRCTSVFDEHNRFAPAFDRCVTDVVEADQIFLAVGQRAELAWLGEPLPVRLRGSLIEVADGAQATDQPGIFAGGDVTSGRGTVVGAIADGRRAAAAIDAYLRAHPATRTDSVRTIHRDLHRFNNRYLGCVPRIEAPIRAPVARTLDIEDAATIAADAVAIEANRCFNCGCVAVSPSDLAPALIALAAEIVTTRRRLAAEEFFGVGPFASTVLESGELVTEVRVPPPQPGTRQAFLKFRLRNAIDFPIVGVAVAIRHADGRVAEARVALSAVAPLPLRLTAVEEHLCGKPVDETVAAEAAALAVADALPLPRNAYKVQITRALVRRAILAAA